MFAVLQTTACSFVAKKGLKAAAALGGRMGGKCKEVSQESRLLHFGERQDGKESVP